MRAGRAVGGRRALVEDPQRARPRAGAGSRGRRRARASARARAPRARGSSGRSPPGGSAAMAADSRVALRLRRRGRACGRACASSRFSSSSSGGERVPDPAGVAGKQLLDQRARRLGDQLSVDARGGRAGSRLAADQAALLERRGDLGGVGLAEAEPLPQRPQLRAMPPAESTTTSIEKPVGGEPAALELVAEPAGDAGLGPHERVERAVRERVLEQGREVAHVSGDAKRRLGRSANRFRANAICRYGVVRSRG